MEPAIVSVGSDASYDLLMEAIPKGDEIKCSLLANEKEFTEFTQPIVNAIHKRLIYEDRFSLRITLFQRIPDPWVWEARLDALLQKFDAKEKGDEAPWIE